MTDAPLDTLSSFMTEDTSSPTKADETLSSAGEQIILVTFCIIVGKSSLSDQWFWLS